MLSRKPFRFIAPAAVAGALTLGALAPAHADVNDTGYLPVGSVLGVDHYLDAKLGHDVDVHEAVFKLYVGGSSVGVTVASGTDAGEDARWALVTVIPGSNDVPEGALDPTSTLETIDVAIADLDGEGNIGRVDRADFSVNDDQILEALIATGSDGRPDFAVSIDYTVKTSWSAEVSPSFDVREQALQIRNFENSQAVHAFEEAQQLIAATHNEVLNLDRENPLPELDADVAATKAAIADAEAKHERAINEAKRARKTAAAALAAAERLVPTTEDSAAFAEVQAYAATGAAKDAAADADSAEHAADKAKAYSTKKAKRAKVLAKRANKVSANKNASARWTKSVRAADRRASKKLQKALATQKDAEKALSAAAEQSSLTRQRADQMTSEASSRRAVADKAVRDLVVAKDADAAAEVKYPTAVAAADEAFEAAVQDAKDTLAAIVNASAQAAIADAAAARDAALEANEETYQAAIRPVWTPDSTTDNFSGFDLYEVEKVAD